MEIFQRPRRARGGLRFGLVRGGTDVPVRTFGEVTGEKIAHAPAHGVEGGGQPCGKFFECDRNDSVQKGLRGKIFLK